MPTVTVASGVISSGVILTGGSMIVSSGGTVNAVTVNSGGSLLVYRGGTALNIFSKAHKIFEIGGNNIIDRI